MGTLAQTGGSPTTVYVVRNLPEISKENIPAHLLDKDNNLALTRWGKHNSYSAYIMDGVQNAIGVKKTTSKHLTHYAGDTFNNTDVHTHKTNFTLLNGIMNCGAGTGYVDMQTVFEDLASGTTPIPQVRVKDIGNGEPEVIIPLDQLPLKFPQWQDSSNVSIVPLDTSKEAFDKLMSKHSQQVIIGSGVMAIWPGQIFHYAVPKEIPDISGNELDRYLISTFVERSVSPRSSR